MAALIWAPMAARADGYLGAALIGRLVGFLNDYPSRPPRGGVSPEARLNGCIESENQTHGCGVLAFGGAGK